MVDLAAFRSRYSEFARTLDADVLIALASAAALTDANVFGDLTDDAHAALAAHMLAARPTGREARLNPKAGDGTTVYLAERQRLERLHCSHWVVP